MRAGVVGGGLAGLVAARDLAASGATVVLFEAAAEFGGQVRTRRESGFVVEDGAEGWVASDTEVPALLKSLQLENELVFQLERRSLLFANGKLTPLQSGNAAKLLGIQAGDSDLGRGIASLQDGMGSLIDALVAGGSSGITMRPNCTVTSLSPSPRGWRISDEVGAQTEVEVVILAAPAQVAATLVQPLAVSAAEELREIVQASNVSVSLGYQRTAVGHPLDASGIVLDAREDHEGLRACAFSSSKLPGRADAGRVLLRAFFRPSHGTLRDPDEVWSKRAHRLLEPILQISEAPLKTWVARWPDALPQYSPVHSEAIARIRSELQQHGPVQLAGSHFTPGGIPGAVRSGHTAARALLSM